MSDLYAYLIGGVAIFAVFVVTFVRGITTGKSLQKAKEADSYAKHLQDIERAAAAKPSGSVSNDPNNRG